MMAFGNGVLREVYGHMGQEATGNWRELHRAELCDVYVSSRNY
jgi:hypothetical protein